MPMLKMDTPFRLSNIFALILNKGESYESKRKARLRPRKQNTKRN